MKEIIVGLLFMMVVKNSFSQYAGPAYPEYTGQDLGLTYTTATSSFRIWSPTAAAAELLLYADDAATSSIRTIQMEKSNSGTWLAQTTGELKGMFYTFRVLIDGKWSDEVVDPYAKAVGTNGKRAMVIALTDTDPSGWNADVSPAFSKTNDATDAVIYELHIRDATISPNSGAKHKGKFLGLAEANTTFNGTATGLKHLQEMGVTHIHLLPFYDFNSIDESKQLDNQYNWGYDPLNYNTPEGSYSTNPADGKIRIRELKQLIAAFHEKGLRVVMDVVYNHTALTTKSNFNQLVPGYYYRQRKDGSFSDATACGNETASERPMMRKFMIESLLYWVHEYHIDGFRFDLMGVHDIETMNVIAAALQKVKPGILLYGEGWTAGASPLPDSLRALKANASQLKGISVFSDDLRDGIKGSVFSLKERGFASGDSTKTTSVKFGITAACPHPQVRYATVNYSKKPYAVAPGSVISYCECHDNNVLWDKLAISNPAASKSDREKMHRLSLTIVLTSQGIPFLHAGTEFLRTKNGVENSYNSGDSINAIDWQLKKDNSELVRYVQALIQMRKTHPAFRMTTGEQVATHILFDESALSGTIAYTLDGAAMKDSWKKIWIGFNGTTSTKQFQLPPGVWKVALKQQQPPQNSSVKVDRFDSLILYQE